MIFKTYKNTHVSIDEYAAAVNTLLDVTKTGGGNSQRAAAQVLLSTYNGFVFKMDLTDLYYLEGLQYEAALTVIRGRVETLREPHEVINNGNAVFTSLRECWQNTELNPVNSQHI